MPLDPAIKSLIAQFRKSPEWDEHLDLELLQKLWPSLVGEQLAAATGLSRFMERQLNWMCPIWSGANSCFE